MGLYEVFAAVYGDEPLSQRSSARKLQPALLNSRSNTQMAQQYGRWIVLNNDDPSKFIGEPVKHLVI